MDNKKISEMPTKTPSTLQEAIVAGKYWIPALMPNDPDTKNGRVDLGEMLLRVYNAISAAVQTEIQRRIDNGEIGTGSGGSGGSQGQSQDMSTITNQIAELNYKVESMWTGIDTQSGTAIWPTHHIKLIAPGQTSIVYQLGTAPGTSSYTYNNPIEINTTNVSLPNFYVTISIVGEPSINNSNYIAIRVTITVSSKQGTIQLLGGTIGSVVITGSASTSAGTQEFSSAIVDKSEVTLGESNISTSFETDLLSQSTLPEGTTLNSVVVTCSVSGKALGSSANYVMQNRVGMAGSGQIKLDNNGS